MLKLKKALYLLPISLLTMTSYANKADVFSKVPASNLSLLGKARLVQSVEPKKQISFTVWLKLRNEKALDQLVHDIYDPNSSKYQNFLTSELYEQEFAPTKDVEERVQHFFMSQGMQARIINHSVRVIGSAEQVQQALHIQMNYYRYQNDLVYANASLPQLKPEIAQYVSEIKGLSTIPELYATGSSVEPMKKEEVKDLKFIWNNFTPYALPTDISLHGFTGAHLQKAYNISNIPTINGVHLDGKGQTLVVVDKCGTNDAKSILRDANQYFKSNNIKPFVTTGTANNFAIVSPTGSPFTKCHNASSFSREILLDIESSHTIAPGNNTVLVLGEQDQTTLLMDTINT